MNRVIVIIGLLVGTYCENVAGQNKITNFRESYIADKITFALTGDAIITRKLSPYKEPQYLKMIQILREADVAYTNFEMLFHNYEGYPAAHSGGTYMRAEPDLAKELTWAGFDMVSLANNHTMDFGVQGLETTIATLREEDLIYAGAGMNLAEARAPGYLETDAGRVAMISVTSSFSDEDRAGPQRKDMKGRPGLNPIRYKVTYRITEQSYNDLERIAEQIGVSFNEENNEARFLGERFVIDSDPGYETAPHQGDLEEILQVVRDADRQADRVLIASQNHEGKDRETPPGFLKSFARATIDAGADVFVSHGSHALRPIEIYNGKPIFYGLGDFLFQNETVKKLPAEMYDRYGVSQDSLPGYLQDKRIEESGSRSFVANSEIWESVVALPTFDNNNEGKLLNILLYPITLGYNKPRPQRGRPRLADKKLGRKIIEGLRDISNPYGTEINYDAEGNIGAVVIK